VLLDGYADSERAERGFPLWRVVGAGLACQSDRWASLALLWLPHLPEGDKAQLRDLLLQVHEAKWASQKSRQLADRLPRRFVGLDGSGKGRPGRLCGLYPKREQLTWTT
jgi:hypothetical protein